jgi:uncharacterized protein
MNAVAAIPIHEEGRDFWLPGFQVRLRDRELPDDVFRDILSVEYSDDMEEIDSCKILINDWDADQRVLRYSSSDLFLPGTRFDLDLGYLSDKGGLKRVLAGEITQLAPTFPGEGRPSLGVTAVNVLHRLRGKQESRAYENKTPSTIAREIARRLDIDIRLGDTAAREVSLPYLLQDNAYDVVFLLRLARRHGYDLLVEETKNGPRLYFGPSETVAARPNYKLIYGQSLVEFQPTLTTANQVGEVVLRWWNPAAKKLEEAKATRAQTATKGVGSGGSQALLERSFSERKEIIAAKSPRNRAEAEALAKAALERIAKDMVKASGSVIGLPDLRAGSIVVIGGVGKRFDGRYFVTKTTHSLGDGGYTTRFECRREEV